MGSCNAATGTIEYYTDGGTNGCPAQASYTLAVPDWVSGPSDIAVAEFPARDHPGGQQADGPNVYEFAVPLNPSCTVTSIALPDVGNSVAATVGMGVAENLPSLHVLGMALRNTTTADPEVGAPPSMGRQAPRRRRRQRDGIDERRAFRVADRGRVLPTGRGHLGKPDGQDRRIAERQRAAGAEIRIRLSNPGFWSTDDAGRR